MKRRIYTDTSAIGGCLDEEFRTASTQLFDRFKSFGYACGVGVDPGGA